jgi:hypothetical protein
LAESKESEKRRTPSKPQCPKSKKQHADVDVTEAEDGPSSAQVVVDKRITRSSAVSNKPTPKKRKADAIHYSFRDSEDDFDHSQPLMKFVNQPVIKKPKTKTAAKTKKKNPKQSTRNPGPSGNLTFTVTDEDDDDKNGGDFGLVAN